MLGCEIYFLGEKEALYLQNVVKAHHAVPASTLAGGRDSSAVPGHLLQAPRTCAAHRQLGPFFFTSFP